MQEYCFNSFFFSKKSGVDSHSGKKLPKHIFHVVSIFKSMILCRFLSTMQYIVSMVWFYLVSRDIFTIPDLLRFGKKIHFINKIDDLYWKICLFVCLFFCAQLIRFAAKCVNCAWIHQIFCVKNYRKLQKVDC